MNKTLAVVLTVFMFACFTPGSGMAKSGNGQGSGGHSGSQDGTGPDRDRLQDGSCLKTIDGKILLSGYKRGKRTGAQDGSGPKRDRLRDGSCLNA